MKFKRKIAPEIKSSPKFITKKRLREDEINFSKFKESSLFLFSFDFRNIKNKVKKYCEKS